MHVNKVNKHLNINYHIKIQKKKSLLQRLPKKPSNTRLKPYTTRIAKIQGPKEGKTYSNIYIDKRAHT